MQRILVPTDFSPCAEQALEIAAQIIKRYQSNGISNQLYLYHCVEKYGKDDPTSLRQAKEKAKQRLEALRIMLFNKHQISSGLYISMGQLLPDIKAIANSNEISMVVMGSNGSSGLDEFLIGSNTQKVIRLSNKPVLVVKKTTQKLFNTQKIAFISDFNTDQLDAFKYCLNLCKQWGTSLLLLNIDTPTAFHEPMGAVWLSMKQFKSIAEEANVPVEMFREEGRNVYSGVTFFLEHQTVDAVIMPTHGRKKLLRFILGSLTEYIANHLSIPVLSLPITSKECTVKPDTDHKTHFTVPTPTTKAMKEIRQRGPAGQEPQKLSALL